MSTHHRRASTNSPPDHSTSGTNDSSGNSLSENKRRRVPSSVTPNACTNCKKAKTKCNGRKPACGRCVSRNQEESCHYETHVMTAKQDMVQKIKDLQQKNDFIESIFRALTSGGIGPQVLDRLRSGESYQSIADSLGEAPLSDLPSLSPSSERALSKALKDYDLDAARERDPDSGIIERKHWTNVTSDKTVIEHLLTLYFTWVHPVHMLFSRPHFWASFKNRSDVYCNSALVNALCAMGCLYLDTAGEYQGAPPTDPEALRDKFMDEARSQIKPSQYQKTITIQTFAVMFLVEMSSGRGSKASFYIRLAAETLSKKPSTEYNTEAMEVTRLGVYALNVSWAEFTYLIPPMSQTPPALEIPIALYDEDSIPWQGYRHLGDEPKDEEPGLVMTCSAHFAMLVRIIHETCHLYYDSHREKISARDILQLYDKYRNWREELPPEIGDASEETQALPHVMSLHVQYHTALVLLFQPLLQVPEFPWQTQHHVKSLVVGNAWSGVELIRRFRVLWSGRYAPPLQSFCLLHLCDTLLRYGDSLENSLEVTKFCMENLQETADGKGGFSVCGPLQKAFFQSAKDCGVPLTENFPNLISSSPPLSTDNILDACTRLSYTQPVDQVIANLDPSVLKDFEKGWRDIIERHGSEMEQPSSGKEYMRISSLLND